VLAAQGERAPLTGTVRLGVIPTIGPFLLPRILPGLRDAWPKLKLYLREDQTDSLLEQLHAGRLDVLALALPYDCGNVETALLFKDRFSLGLRRDHRLARAKHIRPKEIESETLLLLQEGHCLRGHALSACRIGDKAHADAFEQRACPPWCRWSTTASASPCSRSWHSMPASSRARRWSPGRSKSTNPSATSRWSGARVRRERKSFKLLAREITRLAK